MHADGPSARPTARSAVERLNALRLEIHPRVLHQSIEEAVWPMPGEDDW